MAANYPNPSTTVLFLIDLINHFEFSWERIARSIRRAPALNLVTTAVGPHRDGLNEPLRGRRNSQAAH